MSWLSFISRRAKLPVLSSLPLRTYTVDFALDRLTAGVDNVRYDVRLSPRFLETARTIVFQLVVKHAKADEPALNIEPPTNWKELRSQFEWFTSDMLLGAVLQAKAAREVQIDYLAQTAIVKALSDEILAQTDRLIAHYKSIIRDYEMRDNQDLEDAIRLKEKLGELQLGRQTIRRKVGSELFISLADLQRKDLKQVREVNFGLESTLHHDVFTNPLLQAEDATDPVFLLEEYGLLLSRNPEDPDTHEKLIELLRLTLAEAELSANSDSQAEPAAPSTAASCSIEALPRINGWIKHIDNIDLLFNGERSAYRCALLRKQGGSPQKIARLKQQQQEQDALLNAAFRRFRAAGLMRRIVALFALKSLYAAYCPPLSPRALLGYLVNPRSRRDVTTRLESLRKLYGAAYPLTPLRRRALELRRTSSRRQRHLLLRFLTNLARYHRDLENFSMLRLAMDSVNLASKAELIDLSRANSTLYEFLLADEIEREEKPIINHVIMKADIRGSTEVTERLKSQRLNPASHFSLHFFTPITETLAEYGAHKVFIEGDAIILVIQEQSETPAGWYSVSRACGLAIRILHIVGQHNAETKSHSLPSLELGIGIAFYNNPPTYLFDGDNRIMISPAINLADRLSGCAHRLRHKIKNGVMPFNLHVWATETSTDPLGGNEETLLRYNVNGIELNEAGFRKLQGEIDLKSISLKFNGNEEEKIRIHTGRFPTVSGQLQRLVIREGRIPVVSLPDFKPQRLTDRSFFEVCTQPQLYAMVNRLLSAQPGNDKNPSYPTA